jgi:CheY-like chemotaxis protein
VRIIWAKDGEEAIQKFDSAVEIDFILMDIKMPKKDGFQSIKAIRKVDKKIPIIVVTAYVGEEDRNLALELGAIDFITKPLDQELLISKLVKNLR